MRPRTRNNTGCKLKLLKKEICRFSSELTSLLLPGFHTHAAITKLNLSLTLLGSAGIYLLLLCLVFNALFKIIFMYTLDAVFFFGNSLCAFQDLTWSRLLIFYYVDISETVIGIIRALSVDAS